MLTKSELMKMKNAQLIEKIMALQGEVTRAKEGNKVTEHHAKECEAREEKTSAFAKEQTGNASKLYEQNQAMNMEVAALRLTIANMAKVVHGRFPGGN